MWVRHGKTTINNPQSHHFYGWDRNHQQWGGSWHCFNNIMGKQMEKIGLPYGKLYYTYYTWPCFILYVARGVTSNLDSLPEISFELSLFFRQAWEKYSSRGWYLYTKKCDLKWAVRMGEHQMDWNRNGFHPCLGNEPNKSTSGAWIGPPATVFILPPTIGILAI